MRPDTAIFHQHINEAIFQSAVDSDMWGIHGYDPLYPTWPAIIFWVAAIPKPHAGDRIYFRFDLTGYPSTAPTAYPWDIEKQRPLAGARWPKGNAFVSKTFNPSWKPDALYAPCDRVAMTGHDNWRNEFPELWWQSHFKINVYLHFLHRLLNSSDYEKS